MLIRCIHKNRLNSDPYKGFGPEELTLSEVYKVYGLEIVNGDTFVYISDRDDSFYPGKYLLQYFEIVSPNVSKYWQIQIDGGWVRLFVSNWFKFPDFFAIYVDSGERERKDLASFRFFFEIKELIDEEEG